MRRRLLARSGQNTTQKRPSENSGRVSGYNLGLPQARWDCRRREQRPLAGLRDLSQLVKKCPVDLSVPHPLLYTHRLKLSPFPNAYWRPEALQ